MKSNTKTELDELRASGFNIVTGYREEKRPNMKWKKWQTEFVPDVEFERMLIKGEWADTSGKTHKGTGGTDIYCMITGPVSNVVVVDVDSADVYDKFFAKYADDTVVVSTPSGGKHLWFRVKTHPKNITTYNGFPIDIKSVGGQVVVPPSKTDVGSYTFVNRHGLVPMQVDSIDSILSDIPTRHDTTLSDELKKFYNKVGAAGYDLRKVMEGLGVNDFECGAHGVYKCECMFHTSQTPHKALEIYNTGTYFCHGCDATGDMIDMVRHLKSEYTFHDAVVYIEDLSGVKSNISYVSIDGEDIPCANTEFYKYKTLANGDSVYAGLNAENIAAHLINKFHLMISNDEQLYWYDEDSGIYVHAGPKMRRMTSELQTMFGNLATIHQKNEIMAALIDNTEFYIPDKNMLSMFSHRNKICFLNGVYDITTGLLEEHSHEVPFLSQMDVVYNKDALCKQTASFLEDTFNDVDAELEWIGYCMTSENWLELVSFYVGGPRTGKSTYLNLMMELFGMNSVASMSPHDLTGRESRMAIASLHGKMINVCGDIGSQTIRNPNIIKSISGRDTVVGREMYGKQFIFVNTSKSMFACNDLPSFGTIDPAVGRRVRTVVCDNAHKEVDPYFGDIISTEEEKSGLVNMALEGLARLINRGGFEKEGDISEYEDAANQAHAFAEDALVITGDIGNRIFTKDLYDAYVVWCKGRGFPVWIHQQFTSEFRAAFNRYGVEKKFMRIDGEHGQAFSGIKFSRNYYLTSDVGVL